MLRREPTRLDVKEDLADEYEEYREELRRTREIREHAKPRPDISAEERYLQRAKAEREARIGLRP
ncbi:hypothetical protein ACHHYP_09073 [Achlya hypogyna]|uniref:Uncharacterized protein n=1 Tax=Achlya hypogyna TaxID=1202772 RepID=A0A1V9ZJP4_ACHHY|nr:hypothetical protein ACHHYP_09073 [Achlya hypogyna]